MNAWLRAVVILLSSFPVFHESLCELFSKWYLRPHNGGSSSLIGLLHHNQPFLAVWENCCPSTISHWVCNRLTWKACEKATCWASLLEFLTQQVWIDLKICILACSPSWHGCCSANPRCEKHCSPCIQNLLKVNGECVWWTSDTWISDFFCTKINLTFNSFSVYFLKSALMNSGHPCRWVAGGGACVWHVLFSPGTREPHP